MGRRRQQWRSGDIFTIPLSGGKLAVAQVFSAEPEAMNSALCMFYSQISEAAASYPIRPPRSALISVQLTTRDLLDRHVWQVVANDEPHGISGRLPVEELRAVGFVGAKIR